MGADFCVAGDSVLGLGLADGAFWDGAFWGGAFADGDVWGAVDGREDAAGDADRLGVRTMVDDGGDGIDVLATAFDPTEVVATSGVRAKVDPQAARTSINAPALTPRANADLPGRTALAPAVSGMTRPVSIVVGGRRRVPWWLGPGGEYSSGRLDAGFR